MAHENKKSCTFPMENTRQGAKKLQILAAACRKVSQTSVEVVKPSKTTFTGSSPSTGENI